MPNKHRLGYKQYTDNDREPKVLERYDEPNPMGRVEDEALPWIEWLPLATEDQEALTWTDLAKMELRAFNFELERTAYLHESIGLGSHYRDYVQQQNREEYPYFARQNLRGLATEPPPVTQLDALNAALSPMKLKVRDCYASRKIFAPIGDHVDYNATK